MSTAQDLRSATDPELVAALIRRYPPPDGIGRRQHFDPSWALEKLPREPGVRLAALEARIAEQQAKNAADASRYDDIRARGLDAMSDYDITISSGGRPLDALHSALTFKTNHITYGNSMMAALEAEHVILRDAIERDRPPQLALF